jgi:Zn-dependent peptidase ImmA (M78 family)/transcriptional regulator with XRE-family HTH domain
MSQARLGELVGLDRTAISRAEAGERKLTMTEMVTIAERLDRPLGFFVNDPLPAVVSRRSDPSLPHESTRALDTEIELFASDALMLLEMGLIKPAAREPDARTPRTHSEAEALASRKRNDVGAGKDPILSLGKVCEQLGLFVFAAPLGENGPDGGCVEVKYGQTSVAVAVINGDRDSGRRRMTLAHELGHWVCGDAYDMESSDSSEKMINSFAIHFLAPRAGVVKVWNDRMGWNEWDRALAVGATFRLSWSATIGQLLNLSLIARDRFQSFCGSEPRGGDYIRLELTWEKEPERPYLSPGFAAACVEGYASGRLTAARTLELLRGTMAREDLPERQLRSVDDMRRSFAGHGD